MHTKKTELNPGTLGVMRRRGRALAMGVLLTLGLVGLAPGASWAGEVAVAVAANFTGAAKEIAAAFEAETGDTAVLSFGSTGQLFAQIGQGAPFEVFLAADQARPERAEAEGLAVAGSRQTYAIGQLVLWSTDPLLITGPQVLKLPESFRRLAIANPVTAPYGAAAVETLKRLGVLAVVEDHLVQGNTIAQTFQFVETANADLGFVAASQLAGKPKAGSHWVVDPSLYDPIRQDAVLLTSGADNPVARAFLDYLSGPKAREIIKGYGYALPE